MYADALCTEKVNGFFRRRRVTDMKILNMIKKENGAVQVIEATLIFPFVVLVLGFLLYTGNYVLQGLAMYNEAQRIAVSATRDIGFPGYEIMSSQSNVSAMADFDWGEGQAPGISLINQMMDEHNPYRYLSTDKAILSDKSKSSLEGRLKKLIENGSFVSGNNVSCEIKADNTILNQKVYVSVTKSLDIPVFLEMLGIKDNLDIKVKAVAVVGDPAEFVRNTDMAFDLGEFLLNDLKFGADNQSVSERMSIFKQKFKDAKNKLGI